MAQRTGLTANRERAYAGVCFDCANGRRIESDRGAVFYLCGLSAADPAYPKYPALPVLRCAGYVKVDLDAESESGSAVSE